MMDASHVCGEGSLPEYGYTLITSYKAKAEIAGLSDDQQRFISNGYIFFINGVVVSEKDAKFVADAIKSAGGGRIDLRRFLSWQGKRSIR